MYIKFVKIAIENTNILFFFKTVDKKNIRWYNTLDFVKSLILYMEEITMKKTFLAPELEVVAINVSDIITTSGDIDMPFIPFNN